MPRLTSGAGQAGPARCAVVTGAASGLGQAVVERLRADGWQVAGVDLPAAQWPPSPVPDRLIPVAFDVRDAGAWTDLRRQLQALWPHLDLLVNAAGVGAAGEVGTLPSDQWRRVLDTNLLGTALGCETFLPWLREHPRRSHVLNVASITAAIGLPTLAAYSASKAGVVALSEAIAAECPRGRPGVTVICPGFFRPGLLDTWHFASAGAAREAGRRMEASARDADAVARRALAAVRRGRRYALVGLRVRGLWVLSRIAPRLATAVLRLRYARLPR